MSQPNGGLPEESSLNELGKVIGEERHAQFCRMKDYFKDLSPEDELFKIAEAMGFLGLIICEAPAALAKERVLLAEIEKNICTNLCAFKNEISGAQSQIDTCLKELPQAIAKGISSDEIWSTFKEIVRERVYQTGMTFIAADMEEAAAKMLTASTVLHKALLGISDPESGTIAGIEQALSEVKNRVANAAKELEDHSHRLESQLGKAYSLAGKTARATCLLIGVALGLISMWLWLHR